MKTRNIFPRNYWCKDRFAPSPFRLLFGTLSMRKFFSVAIGLLIFGATFSLGGCSKDPTTGTTQVDGQVVESQTKKPVGGATLQVYHASTGGGYMQVGASYPADAQGRFSFQFDADERFGYLLRATAPPGYFTDFAAAPALTAGRKNMSLVVPVLAPAWVRLQLVDEAPKSRVSIHISGYDGPGDRLDYPRDTILIRPVTAGFPIKIIWVITNEKGNDAQYSQDVKLNALDTVTVRIPF
ncbi:hypothetical protein ACFQ48_20870 [Hymenobacter caeli]|uniref:Carboxypeptidase regulatory-like domain-containing protein n=1 Tax=Hymenobacter caeli TaxID=2735894 RepID=A0ABX2FYB7_9BACT|nr:hypothetical protein [Hymenobacter caeli]NRT21441.1 hypothetical protein [Hymenobacter caeli]